MQITMALVLVAIAVKIALDTWHDVEAKVKAGRDKKDHDRP